MTEALTAAGVFTRREPLADYLAAGDWVSSSMLRRFARGEDPAPRMPTPAEDARFTLGDAFHTLLLEPERFGEDFLTLDGTDALPPATTEAEVFARRWLQPATARALRAMRDNALTCPLGPVARWMADGAMELSIYWTDAAGIRGKARPDCLTTDTIVEVKTVTDARPEAFANTRAWFGYDLQAAHYVEAVTALTGRTLPFAWVTVEIVPPYTAWVHTLTQPALDAARQELAALKQAFAAKAS
ncbi:MAG: PD-(D/E)XK nuclease-like domain-containing protein [Burkholderiales bacterium]